MTSASLQPAAEAPPDPARPAWIDEARADVAIVDIGSNSVRLVVYRVEGRAIWTHYNEKVLAGLGRGVAQSGALSRPGREAAMTALRRFSSVIAGSRIGRVIVVATAAVRDADDGAQFVDEVQAQTGLRVRVLSGVEEAHFSALGVLTGRPGVEGVVGDLGGSSLELVRVDASGPKDGATLPLGPFAMKSAGRGLFDGEAVREACATALAPIAARFETSTLHAVGGAWRSIALMHMRQTNYPLEIVHEYEMSGAQAIEAARFVARQSRGALERVPGVSKRRADTLQHAAVVLEQLVEHLHLDSVWISAFGLREGLLYDAMSPAIRARDPLLAGCQALGEHQGMDPALGPALETWLRQAWRGLPLAFDSARQAMMLSAACRLGDVGARLHPDHRADLVYDQVLRAPLAGQSHAERGFLALALYSRYAGPAGARDAELERLVSPAQVRLARTLGALLRLGCDLSGRSATLLAAATLKYDAGALTLTAPSGQADLILGEQTRKRMATLADAMSAPFQIRHA